LILDVFLVFFVMSLLSGGNKESYGFLLIWQIVVWSLWRSRNTHIFLEKDTFVLHLVDIVKFISWKWVLRKHYGHTCSFFEWDHEPMLCCHR